MLPHHIKRNIVATAFALLAGLVIAPNASAQIENAQAQSAARSQPRPLSPLFGQAITAMAGQFYYDHGGDKPYPLAMVRYTRSLGRYVFAEGGFGYAHVKTGVLKSDGSDFRQVSTPILLGDVGIFGQLALGPVAPYAGLTGSVLRRGGHENLEAVIGIGAGAAAGLRVHLTRGVLLRGEIHYRADNEGPYDLLNASLAVGIGYSF